jgi:hypothetical protein
VSPSFWRGLAVGLAIMLPFYGIAAALVWWL